MTILSSSVLVWHQNTVKPVTFLIVLGLSRQHVHTWWYTHTCTWQGITPAQGCIIEGSKSSIISGRLAAMFFLDPYTITERNTFCCRTKDPKNMAPTFPGRQYNPSIWKLTFHNTVLFQIINTMMWSGSVWGDVSMSYRYFLRYIHNCCTCIHTMCTCYLEQNCVVKCQFSNRGIVLSSWEGWCHIFWILSSTTECVSFCNSIRIQKTWLQYLLIPKKNTYNTLPINKIIDKSSPLGLCLCALLGLDHTRPAFS